MDWSIGIFYWFKTYQCEEIKCSMLCTVRQAAVLRNPSSQYCTNDSEAIKFTVKQYLQFKKSNWPTFNGNVLRVAQQKEVCKVIFWHWPVCLKREVCASCCSSSPMVH